MTQGGHVTAKGPGLQGDLKASWSLRGLWAGVDVSSRLLELRQTRWGRAERELFLERAKAQKSKACYPLPPQPLLPCPRALGPSPRPGSNSLSATAPPLVPCSL